VVGWAAAHPPLTVFPPTKGCGLGAAPQPVPPINSRRHKITSPAASAQAWRAAGGRDSPVSRSGRSPGRLGISLAIAF
jgi:hypothetical protein